MNKNKKKTKKKTKTKKKAVRKAHGISRSLDPRKIKPRGKPGPVPILSNPKVRAIVMNLARAGLSQHVVSNLTSISEDTITREKAKDKEFADALDTGRINAISYSLSKLLENVKKGNQRAIEYHLNNALGWGDRQFLEQAHGGSVSLKYAVDPTAIIEKGIANGNGKPEEATD